MNSRFIEHVSFSLRMAMYLHVVQHIAITFLLLQRSIEALTNPKFVHDFAVENHRSSIVLHVPNDLSNLECFKYQVHRYVLKVANHEISTLCCMYPSTYVFLPFENNKSHLIIGIC